MTNKKVKLVLFDLDETLLHTDKTISDFTIKTLDACRADCVPVGFSTSRGRANIERLVQKVRPEVIISSGGALAAYRGERVFISAFCPDDALKIITRAQELSGGKSEITVDTGDKHYWNRHVEDGAFHTWGPIEYSDLTAVTEPVLKICVDTHDEAAAQEIARSVFDCIAIQFSDIPWYKFSKRSATKENAVKHICARLGISVDEVIAFGDDFSDIGMLRLCGTGVAMGNAIDEVKAAADAVTLTNDEDGAAVYLREHVLDISV